MISKEQKNELFQAAKDAYKNSYAPYSDFHVGAALLTEEGTIYSGCNVECLSYSLSSCAERNAIFHAISRQGKIKIIALAMTNDRNICCAPCGACRQLIMEFNREALILFPDKEGYKEKTIQELLPEGFVDF